MDAHFRVSLQGLDLDIEGNVYPWTTIRESNDLGQTLAFALESSREDLPYGGLDIVVARLICNLWECGSLYCEEESWPGQKEAIEGLYEWARVIEDQRSRRRGPLADPDRGVIALAVSNDLADRRCDAAPELTSQT